MTDQQPTEYPPGDYAIVERDGIAIHLFQDAARKHSLLNGLDEVGLTMQKAPTIDAYEQRQRLSQPWLYS